MIDLRSDTVTQPTPEMRRVMAEAPVGDDVYRDDPSVLELEATVAGLLGKDDAVYVPSGTMSNQIAIRTHTQPGDVVLAPEKAHINRFEVGAPNALSGVTIQELPSKQGVFSPSDVRAAVPVVPSGMPASVYQPVTLVAAENSHNGAGGAVWPLDAIQAIPQVAAEQGLASHLDGARLWNAAVASGASEPELAAGFDTVSVCFSKGLGAPMGSALVGRLDLINRARRFKQMFGGGFRQAGMMAAGALYAVNHHRERLAEDHDNAARLAAGLAEIPGVDIDPDSVATNMVYFRPLHRDASEYAEACLAAGVAVLPTGPGVIRAVLHLGVSRTDVDAALKVLAGEAND